MNPMTILGSLAAAAEMQNLSGLSLEICWYGIKPREKSFSRGPDVDLVGGSSKELASPKLSAWCAVVAGGWWASVWEPVIVTKTTRPG